MAKEFTDSFALIHEPGDSLAANGLTVVVLIMDESGSMQRFDDAPRQALNIFLRGLRDSAAADRTAVMLVTFSSGFRLNGGLRPVSQYQDVRRYMPDGGTRLYATVRDVMAPLLMEENLARSSHRRVKVVLAVYTDGRDTESSEDDRDELERLAGDAFERGWDLLTFGYGVNAARIAQEMGFPHDADHARTMTAEKRSIHHSMHVTLTRTIITATGVPVPTDPADGPPSSRSA